MKWHIHHNPRNKLFDGLINSTDGLIAKSMDRSLSMVCIDETGNALY